MSGFSGMKAWLIQRFTGIYIALFAISLSYILWQIGPLNYSLWVGLFSQPLIQITTSLFGMALLFHAWIGLRDVILDYVHPIAIKMLMMTAVVVMLLASGFLLLRALFLV